MVRQAHHERNADQLSAGATVVGSNSFEQCAIYGLISANEFAPTCLTDRHCTTNGFIPRFLNIDDTALYVPLLARALRDRFFYTLHAPVGNGDGSDTLVVD